MDWSLCDTSGLAQGSSSHPRALVLTSTSHSHMHHSHVQENLSWGKVVQSAWPGDGRSVALTSQTENGFYVATGILGVYLKWKTAFFCEPQGSWICLISIFHFILFRGPNLKRSAREAGQCAGKMSSDIWLWLREGVLTQKHPLGREGYLWCLFKLCEVVSGFSSRLKYLQASGIRHHSALGLYHLANSDQIQWQRKLILASWMIKMNACFMHARRYICIYVYMCAHLFIFIKVKFVHSLSEVTNVSFSLVSIDCISACKDTKKEQSVPINSSVWVIPRRKMRMTTRKKTRLSQVWVKLQGFLFINQTDPQCLIFQIGDLNTCSVHLGKLLRNPVP